MDWNKIIKKLIIFSLVVSMSLSGTASAFGAESIPLDSLDNNDVLDSEKSLDDIEGNEKTDNDLSGDEKVEESNRNEEQDEFNEDNSQQGENSVGSVTDIEQIDDNQEVDSKEDSEQEIENGDEEIETDQTRIESDVVEIEDKPILQYRSYVSKEGWQDYVSSEMTGTVGRNLAMEALQIEIKGTEKLDVEYQTHISKEGWQSYKSGGEISGTIGKSLPIEAFNAKLTGELADKYDLYYRVHVSKLGWLEWTKEGNYAGTEGYKYTAQAIELKLVSQGDNVPEKSSVYKCYYGNPSVNFNVNKSNEEGKAIVKITDVDGINHMSNMRVAVWSDSKQSDIVWYKANKEKEGWYITVDIANHGYNFAKYNLHAHAITGLSCEKRVGVTSIEFEKTESCITVVQNKAETLYGISMKKNAETENLKNIRFAVWSAAKGQDDLKWYSATSSWGTYSAQIDIKNHKTAGIYHIHAYGTDSNSNNVLLGYSNDLVVAGKSTGKVAVTSQNKLTGLFTVTVSQVKADSGVAGVKVAAWTTKNGQDDIVWYTCEKQSDGTYAVQIDMGNHKFESGNYALHAYTQLGNGINSFTSGITFNFTPGGYLAVLKNNGRGVRTIVMKHSQTLRNVRFAVWSNEQGQDDIVWYTATKASDGTWQATIKANNHKDSGKFHVHAYSDTGVIAGRTFDFPENEFAKNGWYYETIGGKTYKLYYLNDVLQRDVRSIIGTQSTYKAEINRKTCTVTMYAKDGANGYIIPVVAFACSVGLPSTPTPKGTFYTCEKQRWGLLMGPSYGQYCTRIVNGILFHSVAGSHMSSYNLSAANYNMLGQPASHGCVRLCVRDAKWIFDNCKLRMQVDIFDSSYAGPLGKPATIKIPASQNWDPTDPNV